ncbi:MAG: hypothetical protein ACP5SH_02885 [Syntrophobacteraceae bacterium]
MKITRVERLIDVGEFSSSHNWKMIQDHIMNAIFSIQWPPDSGSFTLRDEPGKKRGEGSGVKPIKQACMQHLRSLGWQLETRVDVATLRRPGPIDATIPVGNRLFCMEWETGNISSSHRALNKMALGMLRGIFIGGALVLPTRAMYKYLTDRVGNYSEIEPYFGLWGALTVKDGLLVVIAVEQDAVSPSVPRIPKGTDGRALQ